MGGRQREKPGDDEDDEGEDEEVPARDRSGSVSSVRSAASAASMHSRRGDLPIEALHAASLLCAAPLAAHIRWRCCRVCAPTTSGGRRTTGETGGGRIAWAVRPVSNVGGRALRTV